MRGLGLVVAILAAVVLALPSFSLASFAGQNGKVFYEKEGDVWSVNPDGTGAVDLTPGTLGAEQRPTPSPDGERVVFQTFSNEGWYVGRGWNIFSMNADGSNQVNLTKTEEPVINFDPSFSPDGTKIVFMRQSLLGGDKDIWVMNADGTGAEDLTNSPGFNETAPEISPDGTEVVYIGTAPDTGGPANYREYSNDIWVMNADGSSPEQLTETDSEIHNVSPTWSPDSATIAYSTVECPPAPPPKPPKEKPDLCGPPTASGLHVMNADGTDKTLLLNDGNLIQSGQLYWSPDGTRIAFDSWIAGGVISTVAATGGAPTLLVGNSSAHYPSWALIPLDPEPPDPGEPPVTPSPGGEADNPPVTTPAPVLPTRKPLKCGKGKRKKVVKNKVRCVKKHKNVKPTRG
jgi:Tol biopolymer transport system component